MIGARPSRRVAPAAGGVLLLVGLIFTLIALGMYVHHWLFLRRAVDVQGIVIAMERRVDAQGNHPASAPIVRYPLNGDWYVLSSTTASNPAAYTVRQAVTVVVDPKHPERAMIDSFGQIWVLPVSFGGIGIVLCAIARVIAHRHRHLWAIR
jgi:Flp pilus assembly protein TadG